MGQPSRKLAIITALLAGIAVVALGAGIFTGEFRGELFLAAGVFGTLALIGAVATRFSSPAKSTTGRT